MILKALSPHADSRESCADSVPKPDYYSFVKIPTALYYTSLGRSHCHGLCQAHRDRPEELRTISAQALLRFIFSFATSTDLVGSPIQSWNFQCTLQTCKGGLTEILDNPVIQGRHTG